mmetsp:Transcript_753/g.1947  ORF Transcript_753/g.1947 Transcript_753/m.1947 type:complete len:151 (+) Transcript_753:853-1305(+)
MWLATGTWVRYHQTKLAQPIFTFALHDRLRSLGSHVQVLSVDPGGAATNLQTTSHGSGAMTSLEARFIFSASQSADDGALPSLVACFGPEARSGDFYTPKSGLTGPPVAVAKEGVFKNGCAESNSAHVPSREVLWAASEKAVGPFKFQAA